MNFWFVLLPLLFYFRLLNNPYNVILRKGYSFPDFNSESMPEFVVFTSFFSTFKYLLSPPFPPPLNYLPASCGGEVPMAQRH